MEGRWWERVPWVDYVEEGEEGGKVGGPVVAEDADVDGEDVGAEGEGIGTA